jgi:hypothetical protein
MGNGIEVGSLKVKLQTSTEGTEIISSFGSNYTHILRMWVGERRLSAELPYFSVDNAHPKLFRHSFLLHLIYLSYLSNVYRACLFFLRI